MKRFSAALILACIAIACSACSDPDTKLNSANGATNAATNGTTNNATTMCTFDADCDAGDACEASTCVPICGGDEDCLEDEVCRPGANTEMTVCAAEPINAQVNNTNNEPMNFVDRPLYYAVQILSVTTEVDACGIGDPGPDIFGVSLESKSGVVLGWGSVISENVQFADNDFVLTGHLDGNPPSSTDCPDFTSDTIVSLGCNIDSYIALEFLDETGAPIVLDATADQVIRVLEWGSQCSGAGSSDLYDVSICTDIEAVRQGDTSSCTIQILLGAEGEQAADVTGF